jgi:cell division protein FtsB
MSWTDQEVRQVVKDASRGFGGCPPAETLARAMSGDLPRDKAALVADHLGDCAECAEDAQALRSLESWAERATIDGASPSRRTREVVTRRWTSNPLVGVAAALFVATTALSIGLFQVRSQARQDQAGLQERLAASATAETQLRAEVERLRAQPEGTEPSREPGAVPNVAIVDLLPAGGTRSAGSAADAVPAGSALVVGILTAPAGAPHYADYTVEVWNGGKLAYRGQGFVRSPEDTFTIALPAALLAPGPNRVRLLGQRSGRLVPIEDYTLRLP